MAPYTTHIISVCLAPYNEKLSALCPVIEKFKNSTDLSYKENETVENFYQKVKKITITVFVSTMPFS